MRGVSLLQVTFKVVCGYVNTCIPLVVYSATGECLHSSFVVFYFVFVFRLLPDVNHGATAFFYSTLLQQNMPGNSLFILSISCSSLNIPKNDEPLPDIEAYTAPIA